MEEPESRACRGREASGGDGWDAEIGAGMAGISTVYDDDDVDFDPAKFQIEEGMVAEVMKRLEEEINQPSSSSSSFSFSSSCGGGGGDHLVRFRQYQAGPFVTINGNEESCGPSFSDSASTVMANIDTRGAVSLPQLAPIRAEKTEEEAEEVWPWYSEVGAEAAFGGPAEEDFGMEEDMGDDGWLARVLAGAGFEGEGEDRLGG